MTYTHLSTECEEHHGLVRDFGGSPDKMARPKIVVLCGSTRFVGEFNRQGRILTEAGVIVLSIEIVTTQARDEDPEHRDSGLKARLDELHKRKIDLADEVLVLNVGGYIGESTRSEIAYAESIGRMVFYLEHEVGWPTVPADRRTFDGSTVDATASPDHDALYDGARAPEACDIDGSHDEVRPASKADDFVADPRAETNEQLFEAGAAAADMAVEEASL